MSYSFACSKLVAFTFKMFLSILYELVSFKIVICQSFFTCNADISSFSSSRIRARKFFMLAGTNN